MAFAQSYAEKISSFDVEIRIAPSGVLHVTETISYDFAGNERHGIFREIPRAFPSSGSGRPPALILENIRIQSATAPDEFVREDTRSNYVFKIGDPDSTTNGEHAYTIEYDAHNAVAFYEEFDEVYWNATGNGWNVPIEEASLTILSPAPLEAGAARFSCYSGALGESNECDTTSLSDDGRSVRFTATDLAPGEGLTGALGFPKGLVPEVERKLIGLSTQVLAAGLAGFTFAWILLLQYARRGYEKRRDAKGRDVIVRQYDAPEGLSPSEVGFLVDKHIHDHDITAEIVYLAEQGYIHIVSIPQKILFFKKNTEYYILKMREGDSSLKSFQALILTSLFRASFTLSEKERKELLAKLTENKDIKSDKDALLGRFSAALAITPLEDLKGKFYTDLEAVKASLRQSMMDEGFLASNNTAPAVLYFFGVFGLLAVSVVSFGLVPGNLIFISVLAFLASLALGIYGFRFFPMYRKTERGVEASEHSEGLKEYLSVAEKDRLEFHFNPKNNPALFEKLLPFAIALKVDKQWARELEELHIEPDWYTDATSRGFTVGALHSSFSGFNTAVGASYASPSSSGSGGGGFSGGGGGGGGGGSW